MPEPSWMGEHTPEVRCCPGDGISEVTVSLVLHTPWGGWTLLLRHLLNSRVSGGISPVVYFLSLQFYHSCSLL